MTNGGRVVHLEVLDVDVHDDESTSLGTIGAAAIVEALARVQLPGPSARPSEAVREPP